MDINIFSPIGNTVNVAATTSTGSVALTSAGTIGDATVRVYNAGTVEAFVNFGASGVTAVATTSIPIAPGGTFAFSKGGNTHAAAITASGSATVYFTTGRGA